MSDWGLIGYNKIITLTFVILWLNTTLNRVFIDYNKIITFTLVVFGLKYHVKLNFDWQ